MDELKRPGQTDLVLLSDEDQVTMVLVKAVENLWEAVNELTRLRRTHKEHYLVTIFGSARIQSGSDAYAQVRNLAAELTELGCGIITGGGPGLMEAANEGAASVDGPGGSRSIAIHVDLPFEQATNPFVGRIYTHKTFFSRLHQFMIMSDAFVVVPGGIGTLLELSMVWQLLQVRKLYDTPLILVGSMWRELVEWARLSMLTEDFQLASSVDMQIPTCVDSAGEAVEIVRTHRQRWLSSHSV